MTEIVKGLQVIAGDDRTCRLGPPPKRGNKDGYASFSRFPKSVTLRLPRRAGRPAADVSCPWVTTSGCCHLRGSRCGGLMLHPAGAAQLKVVCSCV